MNDTISRQDAVDALTTYIYNVCKAMNKQMSIDRCEVAAESVLGELPPVQPTNEMLERCRFEYIHACKIVSIPTPDVTKKDKQDAYAVIKALYPIFGDVPFAKVERGDSE